MGTQQGGSLWTQHGFSMGTGQRSYLWAQHGFPMGFLEGLYEHNIGATYGAHMWTQHSFYMSAIQGASLQAQAGFLIAKHWDILSGNIVGDILWTEHRITVSIGRTR